MTENEAINTLQYLLGYENAVDNGELEASNNLNSQEKEALQFILEEYEQYRAIGTVEEITKLINFLSCDDDTSIIEDLQTLVEYYSIGTVEEFKELKDEQQNKCKDCAGCTMWKCDCANERNNAIDEFANFLHEKAKENNGLRLSSETRSWTHASIYDYVAEFKEQLKGGVE